MFLRLVILSIVVISLTSGRVLDWKSKQYPWENSGQFEGDIKLSDSQLRTGIVGNSYRWPDRVMPYRIAPHFSASERAVIQRAIDLYHEKTCIRMREYNPATDRDYVYIKADESGCWSYVGRLGNQQGLNLGAGCVYVGTIMHEMLHALGFYHMQSATNRDDYVRILWDNIQDGTAYNFDKYPTSYIYDYGVPYDYNSIMHYSAYAFSKNGQKTIETKDPNAYIGQIDELSNLDIQRLSRMYNC